MFVCFVCWEFQTRLVILRIGVNERRVCGPRDAVVCAVGVLFSFCLTRLTMKSLSALLPQAEISLSDLYNEYV